MLPACVEASDAQAFACALVEALRLTPAERRARATAASLAPLKWEARLAALPEILLAAVSEDPRDQRLGASLLG